MDLELTGHRSLGFVYQGDRPAKVNDTRSSCSLATQGGDPSVVVKLHLGV